MKTIRFSVFVDDNLGDARLAVQDLLAQLNRFFKPRGIEFMAMLPTEDPADSDLAVALYWKDFGSLPQSGFERAYEAFKEKKTPKIYVFFKEPDPGITEALGKFKDSFAAKYGHFYCHFETVDSIKFQLVAQSLSMLSETEVRNSIHLNGNGILLGDEPVASLENLPFAKLNTYRQSLRRQLSNLETELSNLEGASKVDPNDEDAKDSLEEALAKRRALCKELQQYDGFLFSTALFFARESTKEMDDRVRKARQLFESGQTKEANNLLDLPEMIKKDQRDSKLFEQARQTRINNIQAFKAKAIIVMTDDSISTAERFEQAIKALHNAILIAVDIHIAKDELGELVGTHAHVLYLANHRSAGIAKYAEAIAIYRDLASLDSVKYGRVLVSLLNNVAAIHHQVQEWEKSVSEYKEALDLIDQFGRDVPDGLAFEKAGILNNLAIIHYEHRNFGDSVKCYSEAMEIFEKLYSSDEKKFRVKIAQILNNLGNLHGAIGQVKEAEFDYRKALVYYGVDELLDSVEGFVGKGETYVNLADLHRKIHKISEAENEANSGLALLRRLAERDPVRFGQKVSIALNHLGMILSESGKFGQAESEYLEALSMERRFSKENPAVHMPNVGMILNNLGNIYLKTSRVEKADRAFAESLNVFKELAIANPDVYRPRLASALHNNAVFHVGVNRKDIAEREYAEALSIRRELCKKNLLTYGIDLKNTLENLAGLHFGMKQTKTAADEFEEALDILRKLSTANPSLVLPEQASLFEKIAFVHASPQINNGGKAEECFEKAISIRKQLAKDNPAVYEPSLAGTYELFAAFFMQQRNAVKAEGHFKSALKLFQKLEKGNPETYRPKIASAKKALAFIQSQIGAHAEQRGRQAKNTGGMSGEHTSPPADPDYEKALAEYRAAMSMAAAQRYGEAMDKANNCWVHCWAAQRASSLSASLAKHDSRADYQKARAAKFAELEREVSKLRAFLEKVLKGNKDYQEKLAKELRQAELWKSLLAKAASATNTVNEQKAFVKDSADRINADIRSLDAEKIRNLLFESGKTFRRLYPTSDQVPFFAETFWSWNPLSIAKDTPIVLGEGTLNRFNFESKHQFYPFLFPKGISSMRIRLFSWTDSSLKGNPIFDSVVKFPPVKDSIAVLQLKPGIISVKATLVCL